MSAALTTRDVNIQPTSNPTSTETPTPHGSENDKMQGGQHKQILEQKAADLNDNPSSSSKNNAYISPSDAILSPATQKLAGFKQRQINKQNAKSSTSRVLFGRTPSSSSGGGGLDDIVNEGERST